MDELEITLVRCQVCGTVQTPPKLVCIKCGSGDLARISGGVSGSIYSFTTIHVPPARFREQAPYHVALVELPHGVKVTARVECKAGQELCIGMPVRFIGKEADCLWFEALGPKSRTAGA